MVARGNNVEDKQVGDQSAIQTDLIGVVGEYAFCKRNNIFPDLVASPRSGSYDCIFKGYRIDVKATHYKDGRLLATTKKNNDVDRYVLAIVDGRKIYFPGWIEKDDFINEKNLKNLGHGFVYALDQDCLNPWKAEAGEDDEY